MDETRSFTVQEAADKLGMTVDQVYRRITRGDINAYQVRVRNLHYRITDADLQAYIDAGDSGISPPNAGPTDMLGVPQVARLTGFTSETIRRMCADGKLPHLRGAGIRGHIRIPRAAVEEIIGRSL